jgi:Ca2+-binding EF-hand superfamily protein
MQLTVNIQYEQLIKIIRRLPANQRAKLKSDLDNNIDESKSETEKTDFQKFLLKGPVITDDQYDAFKENRKAFNQWRSR